MNPNRQNNRFGAPGCGNRPSGRPVNVQGCSNVCVTPAATAGCGIVGVVNDCCDPCGTGAVGGIIIGQQQGGDGCNCETVMPIAMAYVPWQSYGEVYPMQTALQRGTLFRELDLDFAGRRCN